MAEEDKILMEKEGETKRVSPGSVEDFQSVGWEKIGEDIGQEDRGTEKGGNSGSSKGKGPLWSERYGLTENSNIAVQVWSSDQYDNPYITISRGEKDDNGNWENNKINIPIGKAVELAERIKQAAFVVREKS